MESRLEEISEKVDVIDAMTNRLNGLSIQKLLARVNTVETKVVRTGSHERGNSLTCSVTHTEERVIELDSSQKTMLEMIHGMSEDFRATLDVVRNEIAEVNTKVNLKVRVMENQAPTGGAIPAGKIKIPEPKPFCGARNVNALKNFIFDLEQYFKATSTVTEEAKMTLVTMHLSKDAKLWSRSRYVDIQEERCTIDTWDTLRKNSTRSFFSKS